MGSTKIKRNHTKRRQHNKQKQQTKRNSKKKNAKSRKNRMIGGDIQVKKYDDSTYHGQIWPEIDKPHGNGTMTWNNGDVYEGQWRYGKRSGFGTMKWDNGDEYEYIGRWKNGKRSGTGIMKWKNGDQYIGSWKDGKRSGLGTLYWRADGTSHYGFWEDDKRHGKGRTTNTKGVVLQGNWENDDPIDMFTARWPDEVEGLDQVKEFDAKDFNKYSLLFYDQLSDDNTEKPSDDDDDGDEDDNEEEVENEQ